MYPLVISVRLVEALDEYRKNGLPYIDYMRCKNFALRSFLPDLAHMLINKNSSGFAYINPIKLIFRNFLYPNFYFSIIYYFGRKLKSFFSQMLVVS